MISLNSKITSAAIIIIGLSLVSCGVYSFSATKSGDIENLAIPLFEDQTLEGGLGSAVTDRLADAFVKDNNLKVVTEQKADGIIRGTIVSYKREGYTYNQQEVVSEYKCTISSNVQFISRKYGKIIWEETGMQSWGTYKSDTEIENNGKDRAIDKLVEDIFNKTVKGW